MHVYDIEDSIDRADARGLHHAFQVLIDYPHRGTVEGAHSAAKLDELLDHVSAGLQLDQTTLPEALRKTVQRVTQVSFEPEINYAQAAIVVCGFRDRWGSLYRAGAD